MAVERFQTGPRLRGAPVSSEGSVSQLLGEVTRLQPVYVEWPTGADADALVVVRHGLGRVPQGLVIVNMEVPAETGPVHWYREEGDPAWTADFLTVRFDQAGCRVLLEIF